MAIDRRRVLTGLAVLGGQAAVPGWAQSIRRQSDPYAQVDPYQDPRNGFPTSPNAPTVDPSRQGGLNKQVFDPQADSRAHPSQANFRDYASLVMEKGGVYPDAKVQQAMQDFIRPFTAASQSPNLDWEVVVGNSNDINAWAMAGGKMCFYPGLLRFVDSPDELAAVVCHEIGHVDRGHTMDRQQLLALLEKGDPAKLMRLAPGVIAPNGRPVPVIQVLLASYSRTKEEEADAHSMLVLERAGMDPSAAIRLMQKFVRMEMISGTHGPTQLDDSHPSSQDRLLAVQKSYGIGRPKMGSFVPPGWNVLKAAFPTWPKFRNG